MLSMDDGGAWQMAKIPPYKCGFAVYGAAIEGSANRLPLAAGTKSAMLLFLHGAKPWLLLTTLTLNPRF